MPTFNDQSIPSPSVHEKAAISIPVSRRGASWLRPVPLTHLGQRLPSPPSRPFRHDYFCSDSGLPYDTPPSPL